MSGGDVVHHRSPQGRALLFVTFVSIFARADRRAYNGCDAA
jgi:hypothetical protein